MLEETATNFCTFNPDDFLQNIDCNNLDLEIIGNNELMDPMMNVMNGEDNTLSMEDFKFMQQNGYIEYEAFPPEEPAQLCNTDYPGPLNFEVFVDPNGMKNPWEYSPSLKKIYIDMKHKFPINFSVKDENNMQLFVRIMPMFEEDRYFQELVHRCICHEQAQDSTNQNIPKLVAQHIIRCDNNKAQYFGNKDEGKRLSIVVPLSKPQAGTDSVKEFFHFVCKNSCVGGMNRRPIQVIFTLEDERGEVLGRRVLCVRICSCPKRDREKEEQKREKPEGHSSKKRKLEKKIVPPTATDTADTKIFTLTLQIPGEKNYKHLLKTYQSLMASEIIQAQAKNGNTAVFKRSMDEATNLLNQLSE